MPCPGGLLSADDFRATEVVIALPIHLPYCFTVRFWKLGETVNGGLAGMVSVCCGCDGFALYTACLVGAIGGVFYIGISQALSRCMNMMNSCFKKLLIQRFSHHVRLKVDDPVNAVAVHGGGGKLRYILIMV